MASNPEPAVTKREGASLALLWKREITKETCLLKQNFKLIRL